MNTAFFPPKTTNLISNSLDAIFNKARIWAYDFRGERFGWNISDAVGISQQQCHLLGKNMLLNAPRQTFLVRAILKKKDRTPTKAQSFPCLPGLAHLDLFIQVLVLVSQALQTDPMGHMMWYKRHVEMKTHPDIAHPIGNLPGQLWKESRRKKPVGKGCSGCVPKVV